MSSGAVGTVTPAWEPDTQFIFYVVNVSYTDGGGAGGAAPLTGTAEALLQPRVRQAEHFTTSSGVAVQEASDPAGGGGRAIGQLEHGDYVSYEPIDLDGISRLDLRVAPGLLGGTIQARIDSPQGALVGSVNAPGTGTGSAQGWSTVQLPVSDPGGPHELFLVFDNLLVPPNPALPGSMFSLNFIEFVGRGVNSVPRATATADPVTGAAPLQVRFAGGGTDGDGDTLSYAWDFGDPETETDTAAGKDVAYTYTTPGTYTAKVTVSDGHGGSDTATVAVTVTEARDADAPTIADPTSAVLQ